MKTCQPMSLELSPDWKTSEQKPEMAPSSGHKTAGHLQNYQSCVYLKTEREHCGISYTGE